MLCSIITVSLNAEKTIRQTIESVLNQTDPELEYLIMDGGSKDGTLAIAESFREAFEKKGIAYRIHSGPDKGIYDAMNKGIARAKGELVGIINSDDWYEPEAVAAMKALYADGGFDLAFADVRMHMVNGKTFIKRARLRKYLTSRDWNHPTQFVRRAVYDRFRYRCENISDDMDLYFRVRAAGYRIKIVNKTLANFRMGGVSSRIPLKEVGERIRRRYRIYRNNGYSRWYLFECVGFEVIKYILA